MSNKDGDMGFRIFIVLICFLASCSSQEEKKYAIGRDPSWYPLELNYSSVKLVGFTNALIQEIAKEQNVPLKILNVGWINLFEYLEKEDYRGIFSSLPQNQITIDQYEFSEALIELGPVLIVPTDSKITSLEELNQLGDRIVGINAFTDAVLIVQKYPALQIKMYPAMINALEDLANHNLDGVLLNTLEAEALVASQFEGMLKIVSSPLSDKGIRILTVKGQNPELINAINEGLALLKEKGRYQALRKEFFLPTQENTP